jgi:hypothetical protein
MVFAEEEIHVIKLDGIRSVLRYKMAQDGFGTLRILHPLTIAVGSMDAAEAATKWTANAGVMYGSAPAKE